jgi:DNA repair exonuclease SbcCD nuclease subunit
MLHGQVSSSAGVDRIVLKDLRGRGIDYLALGHVHAHEMGAIDQKTKWAYSGCLSGRGFDETGEKGFVLLTVEDTVRAEFVPVSEHPIYEIEGDVSGVRDLYEAADRLRPLIPSSRAICRFFLTGEVAKEVSLPEERIAEELSGDCAFASVKNRTRPILPLEEYQKELSLRGEFVRTVLAREDLGEEDRNAILLFGLRALEGGELLCD